MAAVLMMYEEGESSEGALNIMNGKLMIENTANEKLGEAVLVGNELQIKIPKDHESKLSPVIQKVEITKLGDTFFTDPQRIFQFTQDNPDKSVVKKQLEEGKYRVNIVMTYVPRNSHDQAQSESFGFPVHIENQ
ncbi:hypothetical protein [Pseudalkalibacillus berkeleyi]|uniref:Uncharacterized protein n=1 Tax=Pseudalkalibacillus berkeleyi TaxID=1069813 RepID=A0ABS9GY36_9BACL|nr:hypothetical protein [Pseudalkalibacillus berkeleyi]MCF6136544.1 hypothetical protein [Pseudalkalibacillus berkeleyi]